MWRTVTIFIIFPACPAPHDRMVFTLNEMKCFLRRHSTLSLVITFFLALLKTNVFSRAVNLIKQCIILEQRADTQKQGVVLKAYEMEIKNLQCELYSKFETYQFILSKSLMLFSFSGLTKVLSLLLSKLLGCSMMKLVKTKNFLRRFYVRYESLSNQMLVITAILRQ